MANIRTRNALLSVYNKEGIVDFAQALVNLRWTLWASGGTATKLANAGVPVTDVAALAGDAILGHRVVTLSREIHAGLLARLDNADDLAELDRLGVPAFGLVCVDLYPLEAEIAREGATLESVIELTDIGGPTMLRAAAKGLRAVVSRPEQRQRVLDWLRAGEPDGNSFRRELAAVAESVVAGYVLASARFLSHGSIDGTIGHQLASFKGENGPQSPAGLFACDAADPLSLGNLHLRAGEDPSFNNWREINRQLQTITHVAAAFDANFGKVPNIAIGTKHGNACGAAVSNDPAESIKRMLDGDPTAIFGGLVMLNFEVTEELAEVLLRHGMPGGRRLLDAVTAPSFTPKALEILDWRKGGKCRLLVNPELATLSAGSLDRADLIQPVRGGFTRQPNYTTVLDLSHPGMASTGALTRAQKTTMLLGWAVGSTSNSNTITLTQPGPRKGAYLIGNAVGQQDRVSCCRLAIDRAVRAGHSPQGAVAYSDSFFPFPDGPGVLIDNGITAIFATSGSVRDGETQELCNKHSVALWQLPDNQLRGFFGH